VFHDDHFNRLAAGDKFKVILVFLRHPDSGLTPAGPKSREGEMMEATLCLRLVENRG